MTLLSWSWVTLSAVDAAREHSLALLRCEGLGSCRGGLAVQEGPLDDCCCPTTVSDLVASERFYTRRWDCRWPCVGKATRKGVEAVWVESGEQARSVFGDRPSASAVAGGRSRAFRAHRRRAGLHGRPNLSPRRARRRGLLQRRSQSARHALMRSAYVQDPDGHTSSRSGPETWPPKRTPMHPSRPPSPTTTIGSGRHRTVHKHIPRA